MKPDCNFSPITLGSQVQSLEAGEFRVTETRYRASQVLAPHCHENANLLWVLSGSYHEHTDNGSLVCEPSDVILKPPGQIHSDEYGRDGAHCLIVEIRPAVLRMFHSLSAAFSKVKYIRGGALSAIGAQIYRELRRPGRKAEMQLEELLLELLTVILHEAGEVKTDSAVPSWLSDAREFIHDRYLDPISLYDVAESVAVHPAHLARVFRRNYEVTVGNYIRSLRLRFAAQRLSSSSDSILDIALSSGFYDQSHFTNEFKSRTGLTPAAYRRTFKKK